MLRNLPLGSSPKRRRRSGVLDLSRCRTRCLCAKQSAFRSSLRKSLDERNASRERHLGAGGMCKPNSRRGVQRPLARPLPGSLSYLYSTFFSSLPSRTPYTRLNPPSSFHNVPSPHRPRLHRFRRGRPVRLRSVRAFSLHLSFISSSITTYTDHPPPFLHPLGCQQALRADQPFTRRERSLNRFP